MMPVFFQRLLVALLWLGGIASTLGQGYSVSQNGPYDIEIDNPTFIGVNQDDATEIPIGFDFAFYGTTYTNCWVGGDGFISFGAYPGGGCCGQTIPDNTAPDNLIAVGWTNVDWISAHYEVFGTAPFRRLVITYDLRNPCDSVFYGQVKLFETTNVIELHTQEWQGGECQGWFATQGVENAAGTQAVAVPGRNNNDVWAVHPGDNDFVSFTPTVPSPTYVMQEDDPDYNIEFYPPTDVTIFEDSFTKVPIDFPFEFYGTSYDSLYVGFNGFLAFTEPINGGCCNGGEMMPDPNSMNNFIAPAWTNVSSNYNGYNIYSYGVVGDYPNRKMIIGFNYSDDCYNAYYDGQVKLYEGSNIIEIHTSQWANSSQPCFNTSQGIEDIFGQSAYFLPERNANMDWSVPCCGDLVRFTPTASLPQADAGVNQIFTGPFCEGAQMMGCLISNFGGNLIDSVQVNWTWNGVLQDSIIYTQDIPVSGANYLVNLGNQTLTLGDTFELKAWTSLPNGIPDDNPTNDTLVALIKVGQHGLFTIGGVDPDFISFTAAVDSLMATGICDSVVFHVRPGTYTEHVRIPSIPGSLFHPVLFTSENGDSSSVILTYAATSSDSNYVIQWNGAHHVTWEKMTLTAAGENYGRVVDIKSSSTDNILRHCRINGLVTTSTSNDYACIMSRSINTNLTIESNTTTNGSIAFYHENVPEGPIFLNGSLTYSRGGGGNGTLITGLKLQNNKFQQFGYRGIRTTNSSGMQIRNNLMSSDKNNVWGIQCHTDDDTLQISSNQIYLPNGYYGVHLTNIIPALTGRAELFNNMISVPKATDAIIGLGLNNCQKTNVFHNSILVNNANTSTYAFYLGGGSMDSVYNNVFSNQGGGRVIQIGNLPTQMLDYNDYYSTGDILGYYTNAIPDIFTWREVTGFDLHSVSANPHFSSNSNLHAIGSFLNQAGTGILSTGTDIDGETRNLSTPDLGADEFIPVSLDAAVTALLSPTLSCQEEQSIKVVVTNMGADTLDHFTLQWTINGLAQSDILINQTLLPQGDTTHVTLSSYVFGNQSDSIRIWTTLPNDSSDLQTDNDTLSFHFRLPLNGTYTIGGASPDFTTISDAAAALNEFYTCGPVVFRIRDGIYEEQIVIDSIPTTSAINTITFESESGDSSAVTIQYTPPSTTLPWVILLDGTDYVTFQHLGLKALPAYYSDVFELRHNAQHITLTHCKLEGYNSTSGSSILFKSLAFGGINEYLTITHNHFVNGHYGVFLYNYGTIHDVLIDDNQFINQRYGAMDLPFMSSLFIRNNTINSNSSNSFKAIDLSSSAQNTEVSGNIINVPNLGEGMFLNSMNYGSTIGSARVYNNMVQVAGNGYGIRIWNTENTLIAYNSCNMTGSGHAFELTGGDSVTIHNNIFVSNSGRAFSSFSFTPTVTCNYNDLYSISGNLGFWHDTLYATFEDWQAGTHFDSNSFNVSPEFVSATDLHILADTLDGAGIPVSGISLDIDGNPRNAMMPDIGADEIGANDDDAGVFALLPEMPFARGIQEVKAVIRNYGGNAITSVDIHWQLNQVDQTVYNYSGELPSLQQDTIVLGMVTFNLNTPYTFKSWTSGPNGNPDLYNSNDTLSVYNRYAAVSDTITIGGTSPDLVSVSDAINAMSLGGILDSVHFQVRNGTYHQIVQIAQTMGMSCIKPVVFEAESGNPADVIWDNLGLNNHTVILNGADGIQFKNLTIKSVVPNYHAFVLANQAQCNTVTECILEGVTTTNASTTEATVYSYGSLNNNNTLSSNIIRRGSQGVYWHGNYNATGLQVVDNTFENAYSTSCSINGCDGSIIRHNVISTNSLYSYLYGIECNSCTQNTVIDRNQVLLENKRGVGIVMIYCNGSGSQPIQVANNFILIGQNNSSYGIFQHYTSYCNIYYNTVRLTSGDINSFCYYRSYGTNTHLANNLFDNSTLGPAMVFGGNEGPLTCNYNDLLTVGPNLVSYNGVLYADLEAWQTTNFDTSSLSVDPMYGSPNGYPITSASMNAAGTPIANISVDIDGETRDTLTPDIGCDEFFLANDDVGLLSINYPVEPFPSGLNTVFIKFINNGQDTLTTMQVDWEVDNISQPTYYWTGLLPSAGIYDSLDIGQFNFAPYLYHSIKVWVSQPNGMTDELALNDTLVASQLYPGLMGTYTIGGASPDFDSIGTAIQALNNGGAAGPVTFNIRPGTYLETINLNDYPGSDCDRPVIFQSENGDSSSVIIKNLGFNDNIITLNGTDGVTFQHLTLQSVNPAFQNVVDYFNGAHCNHFLNNQIIGYAGNSTSQNDGVIISTGSLDTANVFAHNLIQYGSMGFYLVGNGAVTHTIIENNVLDHNYYHGVYATSESAISILNNVFLGGSASYYRGIYLEYCQGANRIEGNDLRCLNADNIIRLEACYAIGGARGRIINNFLSSGGTYGTNGLMINNCKRYDVIHNNIYLNSSSGSSGLYFHSDSSLHLTNTIVYNAGSGQALFGQNQTAFSSDYNDLYYSGILGTWNGTPASDLASWQSASGQDAHSLSVNPQFMSATNLHVSNILLNGSGTAVTGVTTDIDGNLRNQPPDIGADEFDPSIANDAGVFMYVGPYAPFAAGNQPITIALKNYGYNPLTSADIRWVVNGNEQAVYHWTGSLPSAQCDTIVIGNYSYAEHSSHDFILWSELPNGMPDSTHINDTLSIADQYPALSGTYTVGGVLPDFNLFSQVEAALNKGGILSDVTFNIRNGTYSTQLAIVDFPRTNYLHQVIFQSEAGDSSLVTIKRDFAHANNYTVLLANAHQIIFRDLTLQSTHGRILEIANQSSRITIEHCRFKGVDISYPSGAHQLIYSNTTTEDSVHITGNRFEEGDYAIYLTASGGDLEKDVRIQNNYFSNARYRSIYTQFHDGLVVTGNKIYVNQTEQEGIVITSSVNTQKINQNDIRLLAGGNAGIYLIGVSGTAGVPAEISNNYVFIRNWGYASNGIFQAYCNHLHCDYNTVRLENTGAGSIAFRDENSDQNIHLSNNIFANYSGGYSMYVNWYSPYTSNTTDYCDLYTSGPVLARYGYEYGNLAALQTGSGQNMNGKSAEPLFTGQNALPSQAALDGAATPIAGLTVDIDGATRHATMPDIGCKEFTTPAHDIGPKLLVSPATYCGLGNAEPVTVLIQNYGAATETGFEVAYSLNGAGWVVENVGGLSLSPGAASNFTFSQTADLSAVGNYAFALRTAMGSDLIAGNDTLWNAMVEHIPALTQPVSNMIPSNGETGLNIPVSLSWAPAPNATMYDVYIWEEGNTQPANPQLENLTQINTTYANLSYGTNYHWRVVAKNICNQMVNSAIFDFGIRDLPDIVTDTVIAPPTTFSGEEIQIEWQTLNRGPGHTESQVWSDAVYLSTDATLNVSFDTYLGAVQNLTSLDSGMAYTQTGTFLIPNGYSGNYYVFVYADRWNNLLETQDNNNWARTPSTIMINLSPTPDLKVTAVIVPSTTFSGQTVSLNATVKNIGTGPTQVSTWYDRVYFGSDPLNYATGQYITSIQHNGILALDSTYAIQAIIPVPEGIFGVYYVYVVADYNNQVFENAAESNNVGISDTLEVILTPPPDLSGYDLIFPDTVHNNQVVALNYSLVNQGGSTISNPSWYDQVYISQAPVYNTNFLSPIGNVTNYGPLMTNDPTIKSLNYGIPAWASGLYYYYISLDKGNQVFEYNLESNNTVRSVGTFRVVNPDMRTSQVTHPASVTAGQNLMVAWNMVNAGPGHLINRYWQTNIYLSNDQILNVPGDLLVKTLYPNTNYLAAGDTLMQSTTVNIPNGLSGPYYIYVVTDATNQIFEDGLESNNTGTSAMALQINLPPYPDLGAREIVLPDTVTAGDLFTLQYEAYNAGMANASASSLDSFYISFSPSWNPATMVPIGRKTGIPAFSHPDSLAIQVALSISPQQTSNQYYLYIKSDAGNSVYEYLNESNNIHRSDAFFVNPAPAVDLIMNTLSVSNDSLYSGTPFTASWMVTNASATHTTSAGWRDALYLSVDSLYDPELDIRFFDVSAGAGGLAPFGSYTQNATPSIPNGIQGYYYVLAVTDLYGVNTENDTLNNMNTLRSGGEATPVYIVLSPSPDLRPTLFSAPVNAYSGQPFTLHWSVLNDGDGIAQNWNDKLYLSTDNVINQGDILLATRVRSNANLLPAGVLTDTLEVFAQSQLQGNYILILKTDADQSIYEHLGESNNQITRNIFFTMPPPSDLLVTSIELPDSTVAGQPISIQWNTKNVGSNPTNGMMREIVYLSADEMLDVNDRLFSLEDLFMYLPPGTMVPRSMTADVSGVAQGEFYALVQTDARDNIAESNDTNNLTASITPMHVEIEPLFLDSLTVDSFYNGQEHYFRIEIPLYAQNENLRVTIDGDSLGQYTEMYLKYGDVPTLADFDQKHLYPFAQDQELILEHLDAGTYYLMCKGHTTHAAGQRVTILARLIDFELLSITPSRGRNQGQTTIELLGTQMDTMRRVYLVRDSTIRILADTLYEINSFRAFATFNLEGQPPGMYTVQAVRWDGKIAELTEAFEIIEGGEAADLQLTMDYPGVVGLRNGPMKITVFMQNAGDQDIINQTFRFEAPWGNLLARTYEDLISGNTQTVLEIPVEGAFGPPGILPPKAGNTIEVFAFSRPNPSFTLTPVDQ